MHTPSRVLLQIRTALTSSQDQVLVDKLQHEQSVIARILASRQPLTLEEFRDSPYNGLSLKNLLKRPRGALEQLKLFNILPLETQEAFIMESINPVAIQHQQEKLQLFDKDMPLEGYSIEQVVVLLRNQPRIANGNIFISKISICAWILNNLFT